MSTEITAKFTDLKDMLKQSGEKYGDCEAFILQEDGERKITHKEFRDDINYLGTALINMGLKGKRIAVISENRYEWEVAYLAIATGTGVVVPLDKALPENEIESSIIRSEVEAIFYSEKYQEIMEKIQNNGNSKLRYYISMDRDQKDITKMGKQLLEKGNLDFINAKIDNESMGIMLFTSGTTSVSKIVMLSHKNIITNIMDIRNVFELDEKARFLSFLPLHHTFECTVGFLYPISIGACIVFSKGVRHLGDEIRDYHISAMIVVPALIEKIYEKILKGIEKQGKLGVIKKITRLTDVLLKCGIDVRKRIFKEVHNNLGGNLQIVVAGGAALNPDVQKGLQSLGLNVLQGYGLTETSPVVAAELTHQRKIGTIGKKFPSVEVKLKNVDEETGVGELLVKGSSVMLGYYNNDEANNESFTEDGWFCTGDYVKIDEEGFIQISGRKKFVIVLQNGKNVYPEELENLVDNLPIVKESMVYATPEEDGDVTISIKVVYDDEYIKEKYGTITEEEIRELIWKEIKNINRTMPKYKYIKKLNITNHEFEKTTTNKIKRAVEIEKVLQFQ